MNELEKLKEERMKTLVAESSDENSEMSNRVTKDVRVSDLCAFLGVSIDRAFRLGQVDGGEKVEEAREVVEKEWYPPSGVVLEYRTKLLSAIDQLIEKEEEV